LYIEKALEIILKEADTMDVAMACRNLWNLFSLNYRSEEALKVFS